MCFLSVERLEFLQLFQLVYVVSCTAVMISNWFNREINPNTNYIVAASLILQFTAF